MAKADRKNKRASETAKEQPLARWSAWLDARRSLMLVVIATLTLLYSLLLFNARISEGGDDSTYIQAGHDFIAKYPGYFFSFNAPGYPLFLSLPIHFFGVHVVMLKALSVLFYLLGAVLMFRAFVGRVPAMLLLPVMLIMAVNSYAQYFASQTYNEAFYFMLQGVFFLAFFRASERWEANGELRSTWGSWLLLGLSMLLCTLVKNVAVMIVPAVVVYFLLNKEWKASLLALGAFIAVKVPFEAIKFGLWGAVGQYSAQGDILKLKDPYDRTLGYEDYSGYVGRFFTNISIYLGKRFWEIIGVLQRDPPVDPDSKNNYSFLALVLVVLLFWAIIRCIKRKGKALLIAAVYSAAVLATSFVVLQARWDQPRIIIIVVPLILLLVFYVLHGVLEKSAMGARIYAALAILLVTASLWRSTTQAYDNLPTLKENLNGDMYAGYTPDWVNFLKMSRWCADSLPPEALVASRKAPMSFIYGKGREFYPVYKVLYMDAKTKQSNPDSVLALFARDHVSHVIIASLRLQPKVNNGNVVNTLHNIMQPFMKKFPQKVRMVKQIGTSEPAYLYAINP